MHRHRRLLLLLPLLALALALGACGSTRTIVRYAPAPPSTAARPITAAQAEQRAAALPCNPAPGKGTMGACTPPPTEPLKVSPTAAGARLIPDVSEFQACRIYSEVIFRVYEGGTERQDANAACHAREARRLHVWDAAYAFLRPGHGGCTVQATRTVNIVRSIGGVVGPIIADAEVWLPPGFVSCFNHTIQKAGYVAVTYTAPGTWPGGAFSTRVWIAAYPHRPPCFLNACPFVAHQFGESVNCRGVFGDCSINEGILSIRSTHGPTPAERKAKRVREARHLHALEAERAKIRRHLLNSGCRVKHPRRACRPLFRRGAAVNREIRVLRSRGIH